MSVDSTISRISQIETMLIPQALQPAAATATLASTTPSRSATAPSTSVSNNFASELTAAIGTSPSALTGTSGVSPITTGATGSGSNAMVQIAESQVGQTEQPPGSNDSPAIAMYRSATVGAQAGEPWCAYFASWVARQAGMPLGDQGQGFGYVGDIWSWAQQTGRAIVNGPGVVPSPGDLIVFGDQHVGIVDKVLPNGSIATIEGNYSNKVSQVIRGPNEATGYVRMG